jgi:hypothetical protein
VATIFDVKYHTTGLQHAAVAKPTYTPGSSSPIEDRFIAEALKITLYLLDIYKSPIFTTTLHSFCCSTRFYPSPISHGGE